MISSNEKFVQLKQLMPLIQERLSMGKNVTFMPRGTSMLPMLHQGVDQVTLSPLPDRLRKYDLPLYQRKNGQYVLHRVVRADSTYSCCGDNQFAFESGLEHSQMIALVTSFTHHGKVISVRHPLYRLYCRYWHYSRPVRHLLCRISGKLHRIFQ